MTDQQEENLNHKLFALGNKLADMDQKLKEIADHLGVPEDGPLPKKIKQTNQTFQPTD